MKDSPSDGSLVQHLQPPRPSLENTLSNEPTQLMSAMSTAPGRHPQDVESNGDTHQLQRFEEAEAELIIQPEPMDPSSFTTKDTGGHATAATTPRVGLGACRTSGRRRGDCN